MVTESPGRVDIYTESTQVSGADDGLVGGKLIAPDGHTIELQPATYALFARVLQQLHRGRGVQLVVYDQDLSTQAAADILNISRQYFVRLLESGAIPFHKVGTHRRVRLEDVLAYRERRSEMRRQALDDLTRMSLEMGDY